MEKYKLLIYQLGGEDSEDMAEVEINPENAYVQISIQDVQNR